MNAGAGLFILGVRDGPAYAGRFELLDEALQVLHAKPGTLPEGTLLAVAREAVDEDRAELIDLVEIIRDCQERSDLAGLEVARKQLSDLLFYLET